MSGTKRFKKLLKRMEVQAIMPIGRRAKLHIGRLKASGIIIAVAVRPTDQVFRGRAASLTEALHNGTLCWMLDAPLIPILMDVHKVEHLITIERDSGDIWLSNMADWSDDDLLFKSDDPNLLKLDRSGFALRYLPVQHMRHLPAERTLQVSG